MSAVLTHFAGDLITADYFRGFLQREPARALRLLTTKESEIQRRYVAVVEALVRQELGDAAVRPRRERRTTWPTCWSASRSRSPTPT